MTTERPDQRVPSWQPARGMLIGPTAEELYIPFLSCSCALTKEEWLYKCKAFASIICTDNSSIYPGKNVTELQIEKTYQSCMKTNSTPDLDRTEATEHYSQADVHAKHISGGSYTLKDMLCVYALKS